MSSSCYTCGTEARGGEKPPRERIHVGGGWRVAHAFGSALPGWLVVVPRRHVTRLSELTSEESLELGPILRAASGALEDILGCEKTYAALFAEAEGFAHLHFHLVPRMPDFEPADVGPGVFHFLDEPEDDQISTDEADRLAEELAPALRQRLG